jgi:membrane-bound lytic murein transglycosylase D
METVMVIKILILGALSVCCSACFPHAGFLAEKTSHKTSTPVQEQASLFSRLELEEILSPDPSPLPSPSGFEETRFNRKIEVPVADESNDDFDLAILPKNPSNPEATFDIPIVMNEKVERFIQFFQTRAKANFSNWLSRSEKYIPFMKNVLRENGLPEDLVYLALIESGFNPYAYSRSKASGPWQFISPTGKRYGLKVSSWVDERRDPEKSTVAAAKYLKDLYEMFECWYLAAAGYNAGENRILNAMKRYRTEDFWELSKYRYLKQETRDYVPQMIAAALIAKTPEKYGFFGIEYQEPLRYERVKVPRVTDIRNIARACGIELEELKELNPELLRRYTPPDPLEYEIKIPFGKKDLFARNFEPSINFENFEFKTHVVKKGETVSCVAKRYKVKTDSFLEINELTKKSRLSAGMNLLIPIPMRQLSKTASTSGKPLLREGQPSKGSGFIGSGG